MNIKVNKSAKAYVEEEILIDAPVDKVYSIVSDINNWPVWQSNVQYASISGKPEAHKEFRWKAGGVKIKSQLHTVSLYSEFGWTGRMLWISAVHNWSFKEHDVKCLVTVEESLQGFLSGAMKKMLKAGMIQSLRELKIEAERNL